MRITQRLTLFAAAIVGLSLPAQESVGTIRGLVLDSAGKPLAGTTLTLKSTTVIGARSVLTGENGEFRLPLVLPGTYVLSAHKAGFVGSKVDLEIAAGQTLRQDMRLRSQEAAGTTVEVLASAHAALDKSDVKTASTLTMDQIQALPTGGSLNYMGTVLLSPGVTGASDYAVIRGGLPGQSLYSVNGIVVRDPSTGQGMSSGYVLDDLVEDVSIIQSPVNAKYGNTSGGIANMVTKTGTNEFTGALRLRLNRNSWGAYQDNALNRFGQPMSGSTNQSPYYLAPPTVTSDDLEKTWEISILGPIIKDRLTFSYGKRITPSRLVVNNYGPPRNLLGSNPTNYWTYIPLTGYTGNPLAAYTWGVDPNSPTLSTQFSGQLEDHFDQYKLFWLITPDHQLELAFSRNTYLAQRYDNATSTSSPGVDPGISAAQTAIRDLPQINYRGIFGSNLVVDVNWGRRRSSIKFPSGPNDPLYVRTYSSVATTINTTSSTNTALYQAGGGDAAATANDRLAETFKANAQLFLGKHQIDTGLDVLWERELLDQSVGSRGIAWYTPGRLANGNFLVFNYTGSYAAGTTTTAATMRNGNAYIPEMRVWSTEGGDWRNESRSAALYFNDLFKLNEKWSFNLGARLENWKVTDRRGEKINSKDISPRLMAQWDVKGDNIHLLSLTAATMRGSITQSVLGSNIYGPGQTQRRYFWNQGSSTPYSVTPEQFFNPANYGTYYRYTALDVYRSIDHGLKPERTQELELRYRRALKNGAWLRGSLVYRKTTDMFLVDGQDVRVDMPDPTGAVPVSATNSRLMIGKNDPNAQRDYKSMELEWYRPIFSYVHWRATWGGNWTISRLTGRDDYSATGSFQYYGAMAAAQVPLDMYNPYGELDNSQRHTVNTYLQLENGSKKGILNSLSLMARYRSGAPSGTLTNTYNWPTGTFTSGAGDLPTTFTAYLNGRGQRKGMDYVACDLNWSITIPIANKVKFFSQITISQVFNSQIPSGVVYGNSTSTRTWVPGVSNFDTVAINQTTLQNWGAVSGYNGVRFFTSWHSGIKF